MGGGEGDHCTQNAVQAKFGQKSLESRLNFFGGIILNFCTLILHIGSVACILLRNVFSSEGEKQSVGYLNKQARLTECRGPKQTSQVNRGAGT